MPHAPLAIAPGTVLHRLTLPLALVPGMWRLPRGLCTQAILAGEVVIDCEDGRGPSDLALLSRWHEDLRQGTADRRKLVLLESEARLRRLILTAPLRPARSQPSAEAAGRGPRQIERMSRYVALHYTEPIRIADIAKDAGLNPDYSAALFRKICGLSLVDYVNEHRVSHAQRLLATSDAKIVDIAFVAGFGSASRFYTAFKRACGLTPRKYRRAMGMAGDLG